MNKRYDMVEIENEKAETSGAAGVRRDTKRVELMELRMRMKRIEAEEERMMFALEELGEEYLNWFIDLEMKPMSWGEMKIMLNVKLSEEERKREKEEMKKNMEIEIKNQVEAEVKKRMSLVRSSRGKIIGGSDWRRSPRMQYGNMVCYNCGREGHVWKECKAEKMADLNKKGLNYSRIICKNYVQFNKFKRRKLFKEDLLEEFRDVFYEKTNTEKVKFCKIEKCQIRTKEGEKVVKRGTVVPQSLREKTRKYIELLERKGIIRISNSE